MMKLATSNDSVGEGVSGLASVFTSHGRRLRVFDAILMVQRGLLILSNFTMR